MSNDKSTRRISSIKREIRVLALKRLKDQPCSEMTWFLGIVFRGRSYLDGVMTSKSTGDAVAEAERLVQMILKSRYYDEIGVVLCDETLFDGSLVDPQELFKRIRKPMVVMTSSEGSGKESDEPSQRSEAVSRLLSNFGETCQLEANGHRICLHVAGMSSKMAIDLIKKTSKEDFEPEAMKIARMVASALLEMLQTEQKV